ncbi:MAG: D-alanyl-D-alanine carboxypeptidase [Candidatus Latescibacterota bacterium]|nr:MAG: D-alanyl-D-alanine carboxypeptidase [Candidatus Latescibacterota bacterium]
MAIRRAQVRVAALAVAIVLSAAGPTAAGKNSKSSVVARAAVVLDQSSGRALFTKNADKRMYPASTTKVLTAILAIESGRLDEVVTIQRTDLQVVPSIIGLLPGERIKLRDLVYGLMLRSGNDAARAIARHIAGSQVRFAARMNAKARELGCSGSHFVNAHGLPHRNHYTTALDLGRIMRYAMRNDEFRKITATRHYRSQSTRMRRNFYNKNKLLKLYEGTLGGKPGYTRAAQQTLVAAAQRSGREVVVVCLHSYGKALWSDAIQLFDIGFRRLDARSAASPTGAVVVRSRSGS